MEGMPIGHDDFRELRDRDLYFVDKSPLIDMVLRYPAKATVITRPRRFGKSLNMSMLDAYLNIKYAGERDRFSDLKISQLRPDDPHKNAYPVINLNFKDLDTDDFDAFIGDFEEMMSTAYRGFRELKDSENIDDDFIERYDNVIAGTVERAFLVASIRDLCMMLELHYGKKPIILVDEYDQPLNGSYGKGAVHEEIKSFMREALSIALKGNEHLRFAVLTGVTRISGETAGPNLNNLCFRDVLSKKYDGMYGFTRDEVEKILNDNGHGDRTEEALEWYGGYRFGETDVCCPWSILYYIDAGCEPWTYWADTSGNSIVTDFVSNDRQWTWNELGKLCRGGSVSGGFNPRIEYYSRNSLDPSIYSVMVATGYLRETCSEGCHYVSIPNREIHEVFRMAILDRFGSRVDKHLKGFRMAIKAGDVPKMTYALTELMESLSVRISISEFPYEAFMTGLAIMESRAYEILDDRDPGNGFYTISMKSLRGSDANVVMAIKRCNSYHSGESTEALAREAMDRIRDRKCDDGMKGTTYLYGIAFNGKVPTILMEKL